MHVWFERWWDTKLWRPRWKMLQARIAAFRLECKARRRR